MKQGLLFVQPKIQFLIFQMMKLDTTSYLKLSCWKQTETSRKPTSVIYWPHDHVIWIHWWSSTCHRLCGSVGRASNYMVIHEVM